MVGYYESQTDESQDILESIIITDPSAVPIIFHEKKQIILQLLIVKDMTIINLKKATGMNPGTIKRHLDDLISKNLVRLSDEKSNEYGIKMKFYRAIAKKYDIRISWPD